MYILIRLFVKLTNISNLDERLGFFQQILEPDTFARQLDEVRQKLVPALRRNFAVGYNRLIMEQKITSLHHMMNSSPLPTASGRSLLENLRDSGMDTETFRKFYGRLGSWRLWRLVWRLGSNLDYSIIN